MFSCRCISQRELGIELKLYSFNTNVCASVFVELAHLACPEMNSFMIAVTRLSRFSIVFCEFLTYFIERLQFEFDQLDSSLYLRWENIVL